MKIVALAGGVGGAKLVDGLARVLAAEDLTVIVNTGDDFEHLGLRISPDLDTVCYTLAGLSNPTTGWGREGETWNAIESIHRLGGPDWFNLGDQDLGTHLERTRRLRQGESLSEITRAFCRAWGVNVTVYPMTDDPVATWVKTKEDGELPFQEYFVHRQCQPEVTGFRFEGTNQANPVDGAIEAIKAADGVVICPSNPWVSIGPILAVSPYREQLGSKPIVAVSPIVGGKAIKGPAAKMYQELGIQPSALAVAEQYRGFMSGFVLDELDLNQEEAVAALGVTCRVTQTVMSSTGDRIRLAEDVLGLFGELGWR